MEPIKYTSAPAHKAFNLITGFDFYAEQYPQRVSPSARQASEYCLQHIINNFGNKSYPLPMLDFIGCIDALRRVKATFIDYNNETMNVTYTYSNGYQNTRNLKGRLWETNFRNGCSFNTGFNFLHGSTFSTCSFDAFDLATLYIPQTSFATKDTIAEPARNDEVNPEERRELYQKYKKLERKFYAWLHGTDQFDKIQATITLDGVSRLLDERLDQNNHPPPAVIEAVIESIRIRELIDEKFYSPFVSDTASRNTRDTHLYYLNTLKDWLQRMQSRIPQKQPLTADLKIKPAPKSSSKKTISIDSLRSFQSELEMRMNKMFAIKV